MERRRACVLGPVTSRFRIVNATVKSPDARSDEPIVTLGDVLAPTRSVSPPSEAQWVAVVRAIASGDQAALRELFGRTHGLVFTVILRIVQNRPAAEELTLDVFHQVWRRAGMYDERDGTVIGWIMNQARSRAIDRIRFEQRKKRVPRPEEVGEPRTVESAEDAVEADMRGRLLRHAMKALSAEERRAIEMAYFAGRTYAEVAEQLEEPPGTIKTRIRAGLVKLRQHLAQEADLR
jgi:RNA polymerase sigma-70 factor, ECF subfamily